MVATRDLAFLVEGCAKNDTKLVLVGDHLQLPEIEAGGTFKGLVHTFEGEDRIERLIHKPAPPPIVGTRRTHSAES